MILARIAIAVTLLVASPALATGKMTCSGKRADWLPSAKLVSQLTENGWKVRSLKIDGGCFEVYGTTPEGDRVEAYFDPVTFEKLYVERRGEVLYQKPAQP